MAVTASLAGSVQDVGCHWEVAVPAPETPGTLSPELLRALHGIKTLRAFPKGATLFQQGSAAAGVYVVEQGEVRVLLPTSQNQRQLLEVVGPGALLGLSESMSGNPYRVTAQAANLTAAAFIPRLELLEFLRQHGEFCMHLVRLLSEDLHALYHKFRSISAHPGRPRHRPLDEQLN